MSNDQNVKYNQIRTKPTLFSHLHLERQGATRARTKALHVTITKLLSGVKATAHMGERCPYIQYDQYFHKPLFLRYTNLRRLQSKFSICFFKQTKKAHTSTNKHFKRSSKVVEDKIERELCFCRLATKTVNLLTQNLKIIALR